MAQAFDCPVDPRRWTLGMVELFRRARELSPVLLGVLEQCLHDRLWDTVAHRDVIAAVGAARVGVEMELSDRFGEALVALRAGEVERALGLVHGSVLSAG